MAKISITRALSELKTLDDRIDRLHQDAYVSVAVGGKLPKYPSYTIETLSTEMKASYQSFQDLLARRNKIKCALVVSNANTTVAIGEVSMTVAEAIERKNSIGKESAMIQVLTNQLNRTIQTIEQGNLEVKRRLDVMLESTFGKDRRPSEEDYKAVAKPFMDTNEVKIVDPLNLQSLIAQMQKSVDDFQLNVDVALSEVNARTEIEV